MSQCMIVLRGWVKNESREEGGKQAVEGWETRLRLSLGLTQSLLPQVAGKIAFPQH